MDGTHIKKFLKIKIKIEIRHLWESVTKPTIKDFLRHLMPLLLLFICLILDQEI